jgi:hypothetical protein
MLSGRATEFTRAMLLGGEVVTPKGTTRSRNLGRRDAFLTERGENLRHSLAK